MERALSSAGRTWSHGTGNVADDDIAVCKLHGSIDWIVAHRRESFSGIDLLFDKQNANRSEQNTGHVEEDYCLWRCQTWEQLKKWISGRDLQSVPEGASPKTVGIGGLGSYKPLHRIPGLGQVWWTGMRALLEADSIIVVGFSMSEFDALAQLSFAEVARKREEEKRPLQVTAIDPKISDGFKARYNRVFRNVDFVTANHETVDWRQY